VKLPDTAGVNTAGGGKHLTWLDVAAITDALRLYEVEDDEAESASMEAAEADADADADADAGDEAR